MVRILKPFNYFQYAFHWRSEVFIVVLFKLCTVIMQFRMIVSGTFVAFVLQQSGGSLLELGHKYKWLIVFITASPKIMNESSLTITRVLPLMAVDFDIKLILSITAWLGRLNCSLGVANMWPHIFKLVMMYFTLLSPFNIRPLAKCLTWKPAERQEVRFPDGIERLKSGRSVAVQRQPPPP